MSHFRSLNLRKEIEVQEQQNQNLELFIERVQKYAKLNELTPYALMGGGLLGGPCGGFAFLPVPPVLRQPFCCLSFLLRRLM